MYFQQMERDLSAFFILVTDFNAYFRSMLHLDAK